MRMGQGRIGQPTNNTDVTCCIFAIWHVLYQATRRLDSPEQLVRVSPASSIRLLLELYWVVGYKHIKSDNLSSGLQHSAAGYIT